MDTSPRAGSTLYELAFKWLAVMVGQYGVTAMSLQPSASDSLTVILYKIARVYGEYLPAIGAEVPCCALTSEWQSLRVILHCLAFNYGGDGPAANDGVWQLLNKILSIMHDSAGPTPYDLFGDGNAPRPSAGVWEIYAKILSLAGSLTTPVDSHLLTENTDYLTAEDETRLIYQ
jgi:hypothetical protein